MPTISLLGFHHKHGRKPTIFDSVLSQIQTHLVHVVWILRNSTIQHKLDDDTLLKRQTIIKSLEVYASAGNFPIPSLINSITNDYRSPIFIDENNKPCAVAHLLNTSKNQQLANEIKSTNNFKVIEELALDPNFGFHLENFCKDNGITLNELALIQPGYTAKSQMTLALVFAIICVFVIPGFLFSVTAIIIWLTNNDGMGINGNSAEKIMLFFNSVVLAIFATMLLLLFWFQLAKQWKRRLHCGATAYIFDESYQLIGSIIGFISLLFNNIMLQIRSSSNDDADLNILWDYTFYGELIVVGVVFLLYGGFCIQMYLEPPEAMERPSMELIEGNGDDNDNNDEDEGTVENTDEVAKTTV